MADGSQHFLKELVMKIFAVLALAVAFAASTAEAGCRGGLLGGRLRGGNCSSGCSSSCGVKVLHGRHSCSSGCASSCASGCGTTVKKEEAKGSEKPKAIAPSTK